MRIVLKFVVAAGDQLVRIDLVAGVPNQPVAAEIEHGVQGQAQLDDAQIRGEVRRAAADQVAQHLAHLAGQLLQLRSAEPCRSRGDSILESNVSI